MPHKPQKICSLPGCGIKTSEAYCQKHRVSYVRKDDRPKTAARGYGSKWRTIRLNKLKKHPICECGCGHPADRVHHRDGNSKNNHPNNLMSMTRRCHDRIHKTQGGSIDCRSASRDREVG